jgi:prepilin-type N-terminal cleavage/methylation domain-containing protein
MPCLADRRPIRRAYTLLELLIVLAIVLVVVSLSWPAVQRPMAKSQLKSGAKQLRVALTRARLEAIESGIAHQFRYQPGTGHFEVSAKSASQGALLVPAGLEGVGADDALGEDPGFQEALQNQPDELPAGVRFFDPSAPDDSPGEPDVDAAPNSMIWSAPIVFYPNGRTFNTRIRLHGEYGYYVDVMLRGLTGASRVGEVQRREESLEEPLEPSGREPI